METVKTERHVSVKTVDGSLIQGRINIGSMNRISDMFQNNEAPFVIIYDARCKEGDCKVFIINKNHIVWVEPDDTNVLE